MALHKDKGYSWLVLLAALLSHLCMGMFSFGVLSVLIYVWIEKFSISMDEASWAASILAATLLLTGPLIAVILHSIGTWRTQLIGSLLSVVAGLPIAFSTEFWHVLLTYSTLQAFGFAMCQIAAIDIIGDYFDRHKDKIYAGLMVSFSSGLLIGPVMVEALLKTFGYKYCFIIMAAMGTLNLPSGLIFRGPQCCQKESHQSRPDNLEEEPDTILKQVEDQSNPQDAEENLASKLETPETQLSTIQKLCKIVKHHYQVLKQPAFLLFLVHYTLGMAGENTFYAFCVEYFVRKGILTFSQAALGMMLCGVSAVAGTTLVTVLSHWPLDRLLINIVTTFLFGMVMVFLPICEGIVSTYTLIIAFGLVDFIYAANIMSLVAQQFDSGAEDGSSLIRLSYTFCCMGIGALVGPVLAGYLSQMIGFDAVFYVMGGFPILSSLIMVPYWGALKYRNRSASHDI